MSKYLWWGIVDNNSLPAEDDVKALIESKNKELEIFRQNEKLRLSQEHPKHPNNETNKNGYRNGCPLCIDKSILRDKRKVRAIMGVRNAEPTAEELEIQQQIDLMTDVLKKKHDAMIMDMHPRHTPWKHPIPFCPLCIKYVEECHTIQLKTPPGNVIHNEIPTPKERIKKAFKWWPEIE